MRYALFLGCNIPSRLSQYEISSRAVLDKLSVDLVDIQEFNCCGYPLRNFDFKSFLFSSARNIALAYKHGMNIIVLCKCCYGSLKKAAHTLKEDSSLRDEIDLLLDNEGLKYSGSVEIKHLLSVLYHDVGIDSIKANITRPLRGVKIATHYGCHALRPKDVVAFDDQSDPKIFDSLVEATGAESIFWPKRLDCCGAPLLGVNDDLSMDIMEKKLIDGKECGADYMCVSCPYCQLQFDRVQKMMNTKRNIDNGLASVLYSQLLGVSMGIESEFLHLEKNEIDISGIRGFL